MKELIEGVEEIALALGSEGKVRVRHPRLFLFSLISSIAVISTTKDPLPMILAIIFSAMLLPYMDSIRRRAVIKITILSLFFSAPIFISNLTLALTFLLRVVSSSLLVAATVSLVGWATIMRGIEGIIMPRGFSRASRMMLIYSERWIKEIVKLIMARKARTMVESRRRELLLTASSVGEMFHRSLERSVAVSLAVNARTFGEEKREVKGSSNEIIVLLPQLVIVFLWVIKHVRV